MKEKSTKEEIANILTPSISTLIITILVVLSTLIIDFNAFIPAREGTHVNQEKNQPGLIEKELNPMNPKHSSTTTQPSLK